MTPDQAKDAVRTRDGGRCQKCGRSVANIPASIHHRRPRGMGGVRNRRLDIPSNMVVLCGTGTTGCHGWLEHHRQDATRDGWLISKMSRDDPAEVPVRTYRGWVLLDDEGGFFFIGGEVPA